MIAHPKRTLPSFAAALATVTTLAFPAAAEHDGFEIKGKDETFVARVKGNAQADARFFVSGGTDQFLVRSARPILDIDVGQHVGFRIAPELAPTPVLQDAYGSVRYSKELRLRVGKFKSPVGLERLIDEADTPFLERALPTAVAPNRDVGAQLHGEIGPRLLTWAIGIFDGAGDGASVDGDVGDKKDVAARVFARPFASTKILALARLGFGVAGSSGTHAGAPASYRTSGQNVFFSFGKNVVQRGVHTRFSPQASWYVGPVGAWFEWIRSSLALADDKGATLTAHVTAWQVGASWVITGEDATDEGVAPRRGFDPQKRGRRRPRSGRALLGLPRRRGGLRRVRRRQDVRPPRPRRRLRRHLAPAPPREGARQRRAHLVRRRRRHRRPQRRAPHRQPPPSRVLTSLRLSLSPARAIRRRARGRFRGRRGGSSRGRGGGRWRRRRGGRRRRSARRSC
jgi:phosphate-selective porin OprO/OprP